MLRYYWTHSNWHANPCIFHVVTCQWIMQNIKLFHLKSCTTLRQYFTTKIASRALLQNNKKMNRNLLTAHANIKCCLFFKALRTFAESAQNFLLKITSFFVCVYNCYTKKTKKSTESEIADECRSKRKCFIFLQDRKPRLKIPFLMIYSTVEKKDRFQPHFGHFSKLQFLNWGKKSVALNI